MGKLLTINAQTRCWLTRGRNGSPRPCPCPRTDTAGAEMHLSLSHVSFYLYSWACCPGDSSIRPQPQKTCTLDKLGTLKSPEVSWGAAVCDYCVMDWWTPASRVYPNSSNPVWLVTWKWQHVSDNSLILHHFGAPSRTEQTREPTVIDDAQMLEKPKAAQTDRAAVITEDGVWDVVTGAGSK